MHGKPRLFPMPDAPDEYFKHDTLTKERMAKGDLEYALYQNGTIRYAKSSVVSVMDKLIDRRILDELHGYYANVLLDLQRYFQRRVAYRGNSIYATEFFSTSNSGILETLYLRVMRKLTREQERLIYSAAGMRYHPANDPFIFPHTIAYREAFDALVSAIDSVRKDTENDCETY